MGMARAIVGLLRDLLRFSALFFRTSESIRVENLVLRKEIESFDEMGIKPRRVDHATRVSLALFTRFFDWRAAVINVRPSTLNNHQLKLVGWMLRTESPDTRRLNDAS
jgi:hypothetical protein